MPVANQLPYKRWVPSIYGNATGSQYMSAEKVCLVPEGTAVINTGSTSRFMLLQALLHHTTAAT